MAKKPKSSRSKFHIRWRDVVIALLVSLGIVSLTAFSMVHWTERQIFTTDNWVKLVGPLPQNDKVATALSEYSVNSLFESIDVEQKIVQVLPERADFLAPTLADRLQTRTENATKKIIQSDRFGAVWVAANKTAHERIMARARGQTPEGPASKLSFNLDLPALKNNIRSTLGNSTSLFDQQNRSSKESDVNVGVGLKTKFEKFSKFVKSVDFLNSVLLPLSIVLLLGAVVISYSRRKLIMLISAAILVMALLQLIGVKAVRPVILDHVQNASYRPAVGVIYDDLVTSFRRTASVGVAIGSVGILLSAFTKEKYFNRSKFLSRELKALRSSRLGKFVTALRLYTRRYLIWVISVVVLIALALAAFSLDLNWQELVRAGLGVVIIIELLCLLAVRQRRVPM